MPTILETALSANRLGISVIPIEPDGNKAPIKIGDGRLRWGDYQKRRATEQEVQQWFSVKGRGLAIIGGSISGNIEIMDFDSREAYAEFIRAAEEEGLGPLVRAIEEGYKEESPKGVHWVYRCNKTEGNLKLANNGEGVTLIETRGDGGYVIIAPSNGTVHPTGGKYTLISGGFETIKTISEEDRASLLDLARSLDKNPKQYSPPAQAAKFAAIDNGTGKRVGDDYNERADWDQILTSHGWRRKFRNMWQRPGKPAHEGCSASLNYHGNDKLYVFSSSASPFQPMRSYDKFAATVMLDYGGDFIEATKALGKQGYGTREIPVKKPEPRDTPAVKPQPKKIAVVEVQSGKELLKTEIPETRWVIPGLVAEGASLVAGRPKLGKSWFILQMALAVVFGTAFMGYFPTNRCGVLYCALEDGKLRSKKRLAMMLKEGQEPDDLYYAWDVPKIGEGFIEWLEAWLLEHPTVGLVIIDTLAKVKPKKTKEESVYDSDYNSGTALKKLCEKHHFAALLVHHVRKATSDDFLEEVSGSYGLTGGLDNVWVLKRNGTSADGGLQVTGRDIGEQDLTLKFDKDTYVWECTGENLLGNLEPQRQRIMTTLIHDGYQTPAEVAKRLDKNYEGVRKMLVRMHEDGLVILFGDGRYGTSEMFSR